MILAGGKNTRFPTLKGFIKLDNETIIDRTILLLRTCFGECLISTNSPEVYFSRKARLIGDIIDTRGPATGILSSLLATGAEDIFVAACDMPFIRRELVEYIVGQQSGYDAVVAVYNGRVQPLLAVYNRRVIPVIERAIESYNKGLKYILGQLDVKYICEKEFSSIDKEGKSFVNINTPLDLKTIDASSGFRV